MSDMFARNGLNAIKLSKTMFACAVTYAVCRHKLRPVQLSKMYLFSLTELWKVNEWTTLKLPNCYLCSSVRAAPHETVLVTGNSIYQMPKLLC